MALTTESMVPAKPQPEPIKMIVRLPPFPDLTHAEAIEEGITLIGEAAERIASRIVQETQDYYEEETDGGP